MIKTRKLKINPTIKVPASLLYINPNLAVYKVVKLKKKLSTESSKQH
jgi:hypothetical protein